MPRRGWRRRRPPGRAAGGEGDAGTAAHRHHPPAAGRSPKLGDAKITWKKGDLVEILGHQASNAAEPMAFSGRSIGLVEVVDNSDETTRVIYFDNDGDRRTQWFKPVDLKPFTLETVVSDSEEG